MVNQTWRGDPLVSLPPCVSPLYFVFLPVYISLFFLLTLSRSHVLSLPQLSGSEDWEQPSPVEGWLCLEIAQQLQVWPVSPTQDAHSLSISEASNEALPGPCGLVCCQHVASSPRRSHCSRSPRCAELPFTSHHQDIRRNILTEPTGRWKREPCQLSILTRDTGWTDHVWFTLSYDAHPRPARGVP